MPYAGKIIQPRDIVALAAPHWPNSKVKATATALGESAGSLGAWHDNVAEDGNLTSRDCGLYQINLPAGRVSLDPMSPTDYEAQFRTVSTDPAVYEPVAKFNVRQAAQLWAEPWKRNGKDDYRRWQPWVAYTTGWAMFPHAWVWHQEDGDPVGPWIPTGRFLHKACRAVANWHLLIAKDLSVDGAQDECERLLGQYGVTDCAVKYSDRQAVYIYYPPKPANPPADGVGPRPVKNDGR